MPNPTRPGCGEEIIPLNHTGGFVRDTKDLIHLNEVPVILKRGIAIIERTDTWLVYDGYPESLQHLMGKTVCREMHDGSRINSGVLMSIPDPHHQEDKKWNHLVLHDGEEWSVIIQKGDLIWAI